MVNTVEGVAAPTEKLLVDFQASSKLSSVHGRSICRKLFENTHVNNTPQGSIMRNLDVLG
jgi:hypothetical protein